jgi:hypothetical protein
LALLLNLACMITTNHALAGTPVSAADKTITSKDVLWLAIGIFVLPIVWVLYSVLGFTHGVFTYPVDDTFIHLAIADNIANFHTWGISPHGFVSASSSVLYPLLLATCIKLFGVHAVIPFILNLIAGLVFLITLHKWLIRQLLSPVAQLCVLLAVIVLTPLPVIVLTGMEHTLQILFCFLFVFKFSDALEKKTIPWTIYLYGFLLTGIRYEGIMLIGLACLLLLFQRKLWTAVKLGFISLLPILIFGIYALAHGSYFFPNSVLIKSGAPPLTFDGLYNFFTSEMFDKLSLSLVAYITAATQRMLILLLITYLLFRTNLNKHLTYKYILFLLTGAVLLHLFLTGHCRFPRYEAYLIADGSIIVGVVFLRFGKPLFDSLNRNTWWIAVGFALLLAIPILMRSKDAFLLTQPASINIYQQQYQMGKFIGKYYHDTPIAFNDIGAVSYFTKGNNLDLWGLGNLAVTKSMKGHYYSTTFLDQLSKKDSVQVAVLFENFFPPQLLKKWTKVASWQVLNNVICADDSVSFYAINPAQRVSLQQNLRAYQSSLPPGIIVRYY